MHFKNRIEAGQKLAEKLSKYKNKEAVIYALPRGGVVLGAEISRKLHLPLDLIIIRKIGHPQNPEYAVCAISESGHILCNEEEAKNVPQNLLENKILEEKQEIQRRHQTYLDGRKSISAAGKIAIIVDDGIATGMTVMAAVHEVLHQGAKKIVVAVPIAPKDVVDQLKLQVNEVIVIDAPSDFLGSVGSYYDDFPQVTDEEVIHLMQKYRPKN